MPEFPIVVVGNSKIFRPKVWAFGSLSQSPWGQNWLLVGARRVSLEPSCNAGKLAKIIFWELSETLPVNLTVISETSTRYSTLNEWLVYEIKMQARAAIYGGGKLMDWSERSIQSCTSRFCADFTVSSDFGNGSYALISTTTTTPVPPLGGTSALSMRYVLIGL